MKYSDPNIRGWMFGAELQWLYETATTMKSVVEIGSWEGKSTHALLSGCSGIVIAVDTFKGSAIDPSHITTTLAKEFDIYSRFKRHVGHFPNLTVMKMDSKKASEFFKPKSVDMIFIDGGDGYFEIFNLIDQTLLKPRGVLAVDNVISHREKHIKFIEAIEDNPNYQTVTLPFGGGLLLATKLA